MKKSVWKRVLEAALFEGINYTQATDEELIRLVQDENDQEAEEVLIHRYEKFIWKEARKLFLKGGDTSDLVQEGLLAFHKAIIDFDPAKNKLGFSNYALNAVKNTLFKVIRAANTKKSSLMNDYSELDDPNTEIASPDTPDQAYIDKETEEGIWKYAKDNFSDLEYEIFKIRIEGGSYSDIQQKLGLSKKAIENALLRLKNKLKKYQQSEGAIRDSKILRFLNEIMIMEGLGRYQQSRLRENESGEDSEAVKSQLNPLLFDESGKMIPEIKDKLSEIVEAFLEYIDIDAKVYDIRLVGSNAAYNYTKYSDIDIHLVMDLSTISDPESIARLYLDSVKKNFKDTYDIKVKGHEVEVYVEDINTTSVSNGVYSLMKDDWVKTPSELEPPSEKALEQVNQLVEEISTQIDEADSLEALEAIEDRLYLSRKDSLASEGELGVGNLVFKELRNRGILQLLKNRKYKLVSAELSLESRGFTYEV